MKSCHEEADPVTRIEDPNLVSEVVEEAEGETSEVECQGDVEESEEPVGEPKPEVEFRCGDNDEPGVNVGNATSPVDEDSGRIEQGFSYIEKFEKDWDAIKQEDDQENEQE